MLDMNFSLTRNANKDIFSTTHTISLPRVASDQSSIFHCGTAVRAAIGTRPNSVVLAQCRWRLSLLILHIHGDKIKFLKPK